MERTVRYMLVPLVAALLVGTSLNVTSAADSPPKARNAIFAKENLVAWCIVPFDGKKRGPEERAAMCVRLGLQRIAYDWREEHVPTFEQEIIEYEKHGLEYFAFWGVHEEAFRLFKKHDLHPQIWVTLPSPAGKTQRERVLAAAGQMLSLVDRTREMGCKLGLYNHGGWGGEPENLVAVCEFLREHHAGEHVGIVYNLHHAHSRIDDFAKNLLLMKPYLLCLNLNGTNRGGDKRGEKILPLGEGNDDVALLKIIRNSDYAGPIGIIGHTQDDVELRLKDNLDGLQWILPQLDGRPAGPKPELRTWSAKSTASGSPAVLLKGRAEYRNPPITVECRVTLPRRDAYNIVVASDTKKSGAHWELFSMAGSGLLTAYMPGLVPDHIASQAMICDGRPHNIALIYEANRVRLVVDGETVADQQVRSRSQPVVPGGLGIGRLVEGGLACHGEIDWVRISKGARNIAHDPPIHARKDDATIELWEFSRVPGPTHSGSTGQNAPQPAASGAPAYDTKFVADTVAAAAEHGVAERGIAVFAAAKFACLSCHRIGGHGGTVGPELTNIGKDRTPQQITESVFWPKREVKPEYVAVSVLTADGQQRQGYKQESGPNEIVLRDPATGKVARIARDDVEAEVSRGTLMPDGLTAAMSRQQQLDLIRFLTSLGRDNSISPDVVATVLAHAHVHAPAKFPFDRKPLHTENWPHWKHPVNRDRIYDYYTKQAEYFRGQKPAPLLLPEFPGLDGGKLGHWGNQNEETWANGRWNQTTLGSVQAGVFHGANVTIARGICVRLGKRGELSACFNPDTLNYEAVWTGGFVKFSSVRHGFLHGLIMDGKAMPPPKGQRPEQPFVYHGFYRNGRRIVFAYRIGDTEYLDAPWVEDGRFTHVVAPANQHPLKHLTRPATPQWPQTITTRIIPGSGRPYAVDTIELPTGNPWNALIYCGGHDFLPDGSAMLCTMQGDVWHVVLDESQRTAHWRRFAAGLHHALGLVVANGEIYVQCRDQLMRLHDLNNDGEADFYECFSNALTTSAAGHNFICGLQRDSDGNFYTASGNQGLVRMSADGRRAEVLATGFRNPDGLGLSPDGTITVPCSEGEWTPASMICAVRLDRNSHTANTARVDTVETEKRPSDVPHFGYRGPRNGQPPELPLAYLPRGLDNSSGGQVYVSSNRWGPLKGKMLHLSFGAGAHFLLLRDDVEGRLQGAIVPLPGEFRSGVHRGRFNPADGQLYVSGMAGWGSYTPETGCFQRVRYTGDRVQLPAGFHVYQNGITVTFTEPIDATVAARAESHFAQCWNYRYGGAYGSPEYSSRHPGTRGHDTLMIRSARVLPDGRTLFLEIPDLQPVNQVHLRLHTGNGDASDLFVTVHQLDKPFTAFPGYVPARKTVAAHPILTDIALVTKRVPNPWQKPIEGAREIRIETGKNLTFATRVLRVNAGEPIRLTLSNPDVVPHNWALVKPGTLSHVGQLANRLVADPEAFARQYIPQSDDVLVYTDIVPPKETFTVDFHAPSDPGHYPYLCTFPGHWMVMNGELIVE